MISRRRVRRAAVLAALMAATGTAAACHHAVPPQGAVLPPHAEFLLASAAIDFHDHGMATVRFRHVRIGYLPLANGERQYRMCGEFRPAGGEKPEWIPFATIQTSGYEQWLGAEAAGYCRGVRWIDGRWTSALQARLDALR